MSAPSASTARRWRSVQPVPISSPKWSGGHALPVPFRAEGVVEHARDLVGETLVERPPRPAHREGQTHGQPLSTNDALDRWHPARARRDALSTRVDRANVGRGLWPRSRSEFSWDRMRSRRTDLGTARPADTGCTGSAAGQAGQGQATGQASVRVSLTRDRAAGGAGAQVWIREEGIVSSQTSAAIPALSLASGPVLSSIYFFERP